MDDTYINKYILKDISIAPAEFAKTRVFNVKLYCFCLTAWIDRSTSLAIYKQLQKEYKAHECSKCKDWYHKACLLKVNVQLPTRKAEFVCSRCNIPSTIRWSHTEFTNTCTSDNFLTILLLYCQQYPKFLLSYVGSTAIETALKASIALMKKGNINEGKSLILKEAYARLNYGRSCDRKLNCYGSENGAFLCIFSHVWKMQVEQKCTSPYCPNNNAVVTRFQTTFSVPSSNLKDIECVFPVPGDTIGYCGSEFQKNPPKEALKILSDRMNVASGLKEQFYECRGTFQVASAIFISKSPWLIPISIEGINPTQINELPLSLFIYNCHYHLGGCSVNTGNMLLQL